MDTKQKAEAYDKLLIKAKQIYNKENDVLIMHTIEDLFPEFKESEDEKIRKHLISLVKNWDKDGIASKYTSDPNDIKQILAWLEKQDKPIDEEKVLIGARKDIALSIMNFLDKNTYGMCLSNMECEDLEDAVVNSDWSKVYNYMKKKLEKQGEQKPVDKVEPKFHWGDCVVDNCGYVWKVEGILNQFYILEGIEGGESRPTIEWVDKTFHLWTIIKDAKNGDVLASELCNSIILFRGIKDNNIDFYCDYDFSKIDVSGDRFAINKGQHYGNVDDSKDFHPATKEQCDTLMKAMTDAGWEFNFDKKKLKKIITPIFNIGDTIIKKHNSDIHDFGSFTITDIIGGKYWYNDRIICDITEQDDWEIYEPIKQNSSILSKKDEEYDGEDYGIDGLWHAMNILEKTLGKVSGYQTDDGFLSHQCAITAVKKLYKLKPDWGEEDERIYQSIIDDTVQENQLDSKQIDWLKSIKSRVQPKQEWSEEDKVRIEQICDDLECGLENFRSRKNVKGLHFEEIIKSNIDWLKSLKDRYIWKPSKEQMDALNNARWNAPFSIEILDSLYNDLKKLTE